VRDARGGSAVSSRRQDRAYNTGGGLGRGTPEGGPPHRRGGKTEPTIPVVGMGEGYRGGRGAFSRWQDMAYDTGVG